MKKLFLILIAFAFIRPVFGQFEPPSGGTNNPCTNCPAAVVTYGPPAPGVRMNLSVSGTTNLLISLLDADVAGAYGIYASTNLDTNSLSWTNLLTGTNGQTNFVTSLSTNETSFYRIRRIDTNVVSAEDMNVVWDQRYLQTTNFSVEITGGPSIAMAILIDDTNIDHAVWFPFNANPPITLPQSEGVHEIRIGVKSQNGGYFWHYSRVFLDFTAPTLVITNPVPGAVSRPTIQLQGYCPESLASLTYSVTNASGLIVSNENAFIIDKTIDTNLLVETTNFFECVDVPLTNGTNIIQFRAVDRAGNIRLTNFTYTLNLAADTNPPSIVLEWPKNGTVVGSSSFRLRGVVDDPTADVSVKYVLNGVTNTLSGTVERDGVFWVYDIPAIDPTNFITIKATDAAGNILTTNIFVLRSPVSIRIDPIPETAALWATTTNVSGSVDSTDYAIWVNGVLASLSGTNWSASDVPITDSGTAMFQVRAIPLSDNGGNGSGSRAAPSKTSDKLRHGKKTNALSRSTPSNPNSSSAIDADADVDKPPTYWQDYFFFTSETTGTSPDCGPVRYTSEIEWEQFKGGKASSTKNECFIQTADWTTWPAANENTNSGTWFKTNFYNHTSSSGTVGPPELMQYFLEFDTPHCFDGGTNFCGRWTYSGESRMKLFTGGKKASKKKRVFVLGAGATTIPGSWSSEVASNIPPTKITLPQGTLDADGKLYVALPEGMTQDFTPHTPYKNYSYSVSAERLIVPISGRFSGLMTQRETNNIGVQPSVYDYVTNFYGTSALGSGSTLWSDPSGVQTNFYTLGEFAGTVPTNAVFDSGWEWHQDTVAEIFTYIKENGATNWTDSGSQIVSVYPGEDPGEGSGNDNPPGSAQDVIPDENRAIFAYDGPSFVTPGVGVHNEDVIVMAFRFYARTWLTWDGALASDVVKWRVSRTIRKPAFGTWEEIGTNDIGGTPSDWEIPTFPEDEANGAAP